MVGIDAMVRGSGAWATTARSIPTIDHQTHEAFIGTVRSIAAARLRPEQAHRLLRAKMVYGKGDGGYRGITYYHAWQNGGTTLEDFIEIAATGEEDAVQLAGTTIHELAHILSRSGHDKAWKEACKSLGLVSAEATGQNYTPDVFDPDVWKAIAALPDPNDGKPVFTVGRVRPCPLGIGTRGGTSRGPGSGSRLRLWLCACPVRVRVASDTFEATCNRCDKPFTRE